jgi:uncharacterized protein
MAKSQMYHHGAHHLQNVFDTRQLADRLQQKEARNILTKEDQALISKSPLFFLATANPEAHPNCSPKSGMPGFVRVLDERTLAFPDYDGNGTFRSLGNLLINPHVALLFVNFDTCEKTQVEGNAAVHLEHPLMTTWGGAQLVIEVAVERVFTACPRYIPKFQLIEHSLFTPRQGHIPPVPDWKKKEAYRDVLPQRRDPGKSTIKEP